ncbi:hypothetical protein DPMN_150218 [Dreissena polymorpha]|uniref:Uncharacterized protein n=1 Tax=Dreissena polymorpha TaxID=45954 RepID=A0A9D4FFB6_DREPO|nr:hypothetical protein DPMN_150218 [Dreissena polymorpha]
MPRHLETNLQTKFHEALTINPAPKVLTRKNAPPPGGHVFIVIIPIFELIQDIIGTNLLTKFHKDQTINVASRIIIFELVQDIIGMNLLTMKNAPPLGSHVFQANITIFKLIQDIIETNLLTKFHKDWTMRPLEKNAPPPGGHLHENLTINVASRKNAPPHKCQVFLTNRHIIGLNLLTKFHEDRTMNVASRVLTRFYYSNIRINAPSLGSHVFQANTNLPTKFHGDWTINAASIMSTMQMLMLYNAGRTKGDHIVLR